MSLSQTRARTIGAMISVALACAINVFAQQPQSSTAVNGLTARSNSTVEKPKSETKKSVAAEGEDSGSAPTGPTMASEISGRPEDSKAARTSPNRKVMAGDEEREATNKAASASPQTVDPDKWQFQVTPFFWLEGLHGNAGIGNRTTQVAQSFSDLFHDLDFFIMGAFEARKGKLVSLTTLEYTDISDEKATPGPLFSSAKANFKQFIFDSEVGYRLYDDPDNGSSVDVLGGIRVWHVSTDLNFGAGLLPAVNVQGSRNWVDAVAGLRGKGAVSKKVFVTGKFDLGGGGSKFTWQSFGGVGYNLTPKIALIGGYRVLDVNYRKNNFVYDMNQRGPIFGLGFKF